MSYDAIGRMLQKRSYNTNNVLLKTEGYSYEPGGLLPRPPMPSAVSPPRFTHTGKPEMQINPDGTTNQWRYNLDGRIAQKIQPNGAYWQYIYDDVNLVVTRNYLNAAGLNPQEIKQFDRRGNLISHSDVDNNVFTSTFDDLNCPKLTSGPGMTGNSDQQYTTYVYDNSGKVLTVIDGLGEKNITTSDVVGRPVSVDIRDSFNNRVRFTTNSYTLDHNSVTSTQASSILIRTPPSLTRYESPSSPNAFPLAASSN